MSFTEWLKKKKNPQAPAAKKTLKQELKDRMVEFLDRDFFSLMIQPVVDFKTNTVFK